MEGFPSIPQLESLRDEWNELAAVRGHPLLRHEWFLSAAKTLHEERQLAVAIRSTGSRLAAVAPLVRTSIAGVERLNFIGVEALYEPTGFLASDERAHGALIGDLVKLRRPLILQRLSSSADVAALEAAVRGRGVFVRREGSPSLGVDLEGESGARAANPTGKLRADLRRARARASEYGEISFEVVAPRGDGVEAPLAAFMTVEASGWKQRVGSALVTNLRLQAFFRTYCRLAADAGLLRFFFLRFGSRLAAAQIAVEAYDRLWLLKIGFDESLARCSPGFLLIAESLASAHTRGLRSYEFLGAAESWEERWRPAERPCSAVLFYPWGVRGGVGASLDVAGALWRRMVRHTAERDGGESLRPISTQATR
jgi:CelD/BcsL family acetyltransferase involved in cellulose biosynthesis